MSSSAGDEVKLNLGSARAPEVKLRVLTNRGLLILRLPLPSLVNMSSALPALGKQRTRNLHASTYTSNAASMPFAWR